MSKKVVKKSPAKRSAEVDMQRQQDETQSAPAPTPSTSPVSSTPWDIGSEIVQQASQPTKTVEEMQNLFSDEPDPVNGEAKTPESTPDVVTTVNVTPSPDFDPAKAIGDLVGDGVAEPSTESPPPSDDVFDPAIHCVDKDGNPKKTQSGKYRRKRGKAGQTAKQQNQFESYQCIAPVSTISMVQMILDTSTMIVAKFYGDEWKMTPDERGILTDAYARYVHYKGWDSMATPEMFLLGVTCAYLMPRIMSDKLLGKLFGVPQNAQSNSRPPGTRENNTGNVTNPPSGIPRTNGNHFRPAPIAGVGGTINISELNRSFDTGSGQNSKQNSGGG